jgi:hypothetical protein
VATKKVRDRRKRLAIERGDELSGEEASVTKEQLRYIRSLMKESASCEKVSAEEFELQGSVTTRREIRRLVGSAAYREALERKGREPEQWNWQAYDRKQGLVPNEKVEDYEDNFNLENEIAKVDAGLSYKKKGSPSPFKPM